VNRLHCNPHYGVTQRQYRKKKNLLRNRTDAQLVEVVDGSRMTLDENEQKCFVSLDSEFDSDIDALNLEMIFEELIVKDDPRHPEGHRILVAARNSRDNRGPTVGWSGNHLTKINIDDGYADLNCVKGTKYLTPTLVNASNLFKKAFLSSGLSGELISPYPPG
jgi:hypothetical protein